MYSQTYTRFFVLIVVALFLGFIGMEVSTMGLTLGEDQLSGHAVNTFEDVEGQTLEASPASNLIYFLIGVLAGATIVGTTVYVYYSEKKRKF